MKRKLYTVLTFARINTRRYFRDRTAIFFTVAFPLIFLFVFGGLFGNSNNSVSFNIALLNQSNTQASQTIAKELNDGKILKVNTDVTNINDAKQRMNRGEIDATIILPPNFGDVKKGTTYPSGQAEILYSQNNAQAAQTLQSVLQGEFKAINAKLVDNKEPFTVTSQQTNDQSLSSFDYTFTGLLGFSVLGMGIFGPINIFPELKKQGILRRFHTTPIRVWQYFMSTMITQAAIGLFAMAVLFAVAISVFHLKVVGNVFELAIYIVLSIMMILGIGLALGGWAKNERQAAPLSNIVTFPMMFLSGTFFPRFLMPEWLQHVSAFLPLTPVIDGLRMIATEGKHLVDILPQLGLIGLWGIVIYAVAFRVFRWE
jgi:ABC-2 type transport system permease protein